MQYKYGNVKYEQADTLSHTHTSITHPHMHTQIAFT